MPTALPLPGAEDALYVMDLSGYVFRAYHAIRPLSSPKGEPTHATLGTLTMIQKLIAERRPSLLAVAMDSRGPTFRKEILPEYKANRPPAPEDLKVQMVRTREIVEAMRIPIWQCDGLEADDLIATSVVKARAEGLRVVIVSADKDLMQLVTDDVLMWDTMNNKVYGPDEVTAKWGVPPELIGDLLALVGDSSDNIPGVKSIGPKTAADLLKQFPSLTALFDGLDSVKNARIRGLLSEARDQVFAARSLVALRSDCVLQFDRELLRTGNPDTERLRQLYLELGFNRLLDALGPRPAPAPSPDSRPSTEVETPSQQPERPSVEPSVPRGPGTYRSIHDEAGLRDLVEACRKAGRFALDAEATSTEAMRADLVGIAISCVPGQGWYIPIAHRYIGAPPQLPLATVRDLLAPLFADDRVAKIGHCIKTDEIILRRNGFPKLRGISADTMIAGYLVDPEASNSLRDLARQLLDIEMTSFDQVTSKTKGRQLCFDEVDIEQATPYAGADPDMTLRLADRFVPQLEGEGLLDLMTNLELPLSRVLADIEMTGVLVDVARLQSLGSVLDGQISELEARAKEQAGHDFNVNSPRQLETILFDELKLPVVKRTKTSRSTDASVLEALAEQHQLPATILEQRQLAKLKGTYIEALPRLVNPTTGRIHTSFNQGVAATGRLSSSDPNLQNIPVRTEVGRLIREAFVPAPGNLLVSADYSQIELRVLAHFAHEPALIEAFRNGEDVHVRTAMEVFGVPADGVTDEMRRRAKTINFGVMYGMGEVALAKRLGISREEASSFIEAYFRRYSKVKGFMDQTVESARAGQAVRTILGRRRHLRDMHSANRQLRAQAERIAGNTPIQGSAADILKLAMVKLADPVVPGARMILTVHDELVFEVPEAKAEEASKLIREAMEGVIKLEVPLTVDVGIGKNWAEAH